MAKISQTAADRLKRYIAEHGTEDRQAIIEYANALVNHYGQASGALACDMYEATAAAQGAAIQSAQTAPLPDYNEVAKAVNGTLKSSQTPNAIGRLVKRTGADTTLLNAQRDGAQFAWVPHGDTCAFCLALASRGWQYMSKKALKNGHAEHIHANCDCQYAVRFDKKSTVAGYNPEKYREIYESAEGSTPQEKINSLRREQYAAEKAAARQTIQKFNPLPADKVVNVLRESSEAWINSLSDTEIKAIQKYTYNSGDKKPKRFFEQLNAMLRGDIPENEKMQEYADIISGAIKKNKLEYDVIAYRRLDKDIYSGIIPGDVLSELQFISTSVNRKGTMAKPYEVIIRIPKGSRAAYIEGISNYPKQRELLLDKDNLFSVISKQDDMIELEVIP